MAHDSTITSVAMGEGPERVVPAGRPQLVLIAISDAPGAPSSRHLLDDIDEVRFGRGERAATRAGRVLTLRIPDPRMSSQHGTLVRRTAGWTLLDPASKNGAVVDGTVAREAAIGDGAVIELGHTFLVFRLAAVEPDAPLDVDDDGLDPGAPVLRTFDGVLAERFATLARVAQTEISVLLQGETGTGKELIARALHALSRRPGPLVAVNCGALPANLLEAELFGYRRGAFTGAVGERTGLVRTADQGTLFLDEVGELPAASQAAFLRVLQEREVMPVGADQPVKVDVRLCAATLRDLEVLVAAGQFRRDLYARLFGLTIELVPLRARRVDLGLLIRTLLATVPGGAELRIAPGALRAMLRYAWPLNIRELEKVLTTAAALAPAGVIEIAHLPDALRRDSPAAQSPGAPSGAVQVDERAPLGVERGGDDALRAQLVRVLTAHEGNVVAVARALGTRRTQVYRWIHRFGIEVEAFRPRRET